MTLSLAALAPGLAGCKDDAAEGDAASAEAPGRGATAGQSPRQPGTTLPATASEGGAASPEAAFEQLKQGANSRDYRAFFKVLATESQNQMLVGMMIGAGITLAPMGTKPNPDKKRELDAILAKYGVKDDGSQPKPGPPAQMMAEIGKKLESVKDRPGLFHDLMLYLEKNSLREDRGTVVSLEGLKRLGGDKASGTVLVKYQSGKTERRPVEFRQVGGSWYVLVTKWR